MACLPQLGSVPAAYAVVAGGCDWPLPPAVRLSNNDVTALRALLQSRQLRYVSYVPYVAYVACVALDGTPALIGFNLRRLEAPQKGLAAAQRTYSSLCEIFYRGVRTSSVVVRAYRRC